MAELTLKYTDSKNVIHSVQHITLLDDDKIEKEQLARELYKALTQKGTIGSRFNSCSA